MACGLNSLKIHRHPRGHIADCNGSIEAVGANIEACRDYSNTENSQFEALLAERQLYEKLISQSQQIERFQRKVKERIKKRLKENSLDNQSVCPVPPTIAVERHNHTVCVEHPKTKSADFCEGQMKVVNGRKDRERAFKKLLSVSEYSNKINHNNSSDSVSSASPEQERKDIGMRDIETWESVSSNNQKSTTKKKTVNFVPQDKVKLEQKKELAAQHLAVRRMYSAIERQQSRADAEHRQIQSCVNKLKNMREKERRKIEDECYSSVSEEDCDDEERERWLETIALERRFQKLKKEKEMDRYFQALHHQMKEKMPDLPSLCPCHPSLWASDPNLCARNCQYFQNQPKFAHAVRSLLKSVS